MARVGRHFLLGLMTGAVLTLALLEWWGVFLQRAVQEAAQPELLRPLATLSSLHSPGSLIRLSPPWLPETSGAQHEVWRVRSLEGKEMALAEFKGRVVFLDFWSTTCAPCIEEMPAIERLRSSVDGESVVFLAVTQDEEQSVRDFLLTHPIGVPIYLAGSDLPQDLPVRGVPTTYILDPAGAAVARELGPANWDNDLVRSFLGSLQQTKP